MRAGDLISTIRLDGPRPSDKVLLDTVTRVAIGNLGAARAGHHLTDAPPGEGGGQAWAGSDAATRSSR